MWNQFYVLEEHIGPEPQYVGKVRAAIVCSQKYRDLTIEQASPVQHAVENMNISERF